jgi:hypothetical protein
MTRRSIPVSLVLSAAFLLVSALTVFAKDDAIVTLDASIPGDAEPGSEITVGWTVETLGEGGQPVPFNAEAMFVRVIPASGDAVDIVGRQDQPGHYVATVTVPAGGIGEVAFGLRGESCTAGTCQRSDLMFTIDDSTTPAIAPGAAVRAPEAGAPAAPVDETVPVTATNDPQPLAVLGLVLASTALLGALVVVRARGRTLSAGSSRS